LANLSGLAREIIFLTNYNTVSGRKRAKGPMLQKRANHDVFNNAMTEYFDLISNCRVANDGMGPIVTRLPSLISPSKMTLISIVCQIHQLALNILDIKALITDNG
jgi:hypothetical protein